MPVPQRRRRQVLPDRNEDFRDARNLLQYIFRETIVGAPEPTPMQYDICDAMQSAAWLTVFGEQRPEYRYVDEDSRLIIQALRGWTSGLAVPQFVIDSPGGGGKVPLLPEYVEEINDEEVVFRNYEGKRFVYKQPRQPIPATMPGIAAEHDVVPIAAGKAAKKKRVARNRKSANG